MLKARRKLFFIFLKNAVDRMLGILYKESGRGVSTLCEKGMIMGTLFDILLVIFGFSAAVFLGLGWVGLGYIRSKKKDGGRRC